MSASVGQDIESICGKCGDVWHVVVALKGGAIAKVQCKQCGGYHRHKPPGGGGASSARPRPAQAKDRPARKKSQSTPEPAIAADPSRPPRPYRISESFEVGDTVVHPSFGTGVVEQVLEDRKIQVFFPDGRRVLAHRR